MPSFAEGARGHLITPLRAAPDSAADPVWDEFDSELKKKVQAHRPDGRVDPELYLKLTGKPWPDLSDRALMVIGGTENHGFWTKITVERALNDDSGITAGFVGFTAASGSLLKVLFKIPEPIRQDALTKNAISKEESEAFAKLLGLRQMGTKSQRRQQAISLFAPKGTLLPRWKGFLQQVLKTKDGRAAQLEVAKDEYWNKAMALAKELGIEKDEPGVVLALSLVINSTVEIADGLEIQGTGRERRRQVARAWAEQLKRQYVSNFETRHLGLATGRGFPNQHFIDLAAWGIEPDPTPPARSRILALGIGRPATALPALEAAAVQKKVVEENLRETPAMQQRIQAVAFPFPDFSSFWRKGLLASGERAARARRLELLDELNQKPISCLILGGAQFGSNTLKAAKSSFALGAYSQALAWRATDLFFPLCPSFESGLVILYGSSGIGPAPSFAHSLREELMRMHLAPPLILGWEGPTGTMPGKGSALDAFANAFFGELALLIPVVVPPEKKLETLVSTAAREVLQLWGKSCFNSFALHPSFGGLWRRPRLIRKTEVLSACAALAPDGTRWRARAQPAGNGLYLEQLP